MYILLLFDVAGDRYSVFLKGMACLVGMEILWKENLKKEHSDTNVTAPTTDTMKAYKVLEEEDEGRARRICHR